MAEMVQGAVEDRGVVVIEARRELTEGVVELTLARPDGSRLPDWAPGAHIDLVLADGTVRQYSLCGDRWDAHRYRIAVQREDDGRGGSRAVHALRPGDTVGFGGPRNTFRLAPAPEYLFIAGGSGITPLLPMVRQAELLDIPWRMLYLGRSRERLAYLDELSRHGDRVHVHDAGELGRADLDTWRPADAATRVYACGPSRLLDAVEAWGAPPAGHAPRVERFTALTDTTAAATRFEAVAARSGVRVTVEPHETLAGALARGGVRVVTSCGQGVCGTCETDVLAGVPDPRDTLRDDDDRRAGQCMFPCVSRSRGDLLVLDL